MAAKSVPIRKPPTESPPTRPVIKPLERNATPGEVVPMTKPSSTPLSPAHIALAVPRTSEMMRLELAIAELRDRRADIWEELRARIGRNKKSDDDKSVNLLAREREDIERQISGLRLELRPHREEHRQRVSAALHPARVEAARAMLSGIDQLRSGCLQLDEALRAGGDLPLHLQSSIATVTPYLNALEALARGCINAYVPS
jgi:hypothetical protein